MIITFKISAASCATVSFSVNKQFVHVLTNLVKCFKHFTTSKLYKNIKTIKKSN